MGLHKNYFPQDGALAMPDWKLLDYRLAIETLADVPSESIASESQLRQLLRQATDETPGVFILRRYR